MENLPSPRDRLFVLAMYQRENPDRAPEEGPQRLPALGRVIQLLIRGLNSYTLLHDPRVIAALHEQDKLRLRAIAPRALLALEDGVEDLRHKDHGRGVAMALDRAFPLTTADS